MPATAKNTNLRLVKPRTFTATERTLDEIRSLIFSCGMTYKQLSTKSGVSVSAIGNLATGKTSWPRPSTFNPLLEYFGYSLTLTRR